MPLTSPASAKDGGDLCPGKLPSSSSFMEVERITGDEELVAPVLSVTRTEFEPDRIVEALGTPEKF